LNALFSNVNPPLEPRQLDKFVSAALARDSPVSFVSQEPLDSLSTSFFLLLHLFTKHERRSGPPVMRQSGKKNAHFVFVFHCFGQGCIFFWRGFQNLNVIALSAFCPLSPSERRGSLPVSAVFHSTEVMEKQLARFQIGGQFDSLATPAQLTSSLAVQESYPITRHRPCVT